MFHHGIPEFGKKALVRFGKLVGSALAGIPVKSTQTLPVLQKITQTGQQEFRPERLGNIGIRSAIVTLYLLVLSGIGSEHHHRYMRGTHLRLEPAAEFHSVHHRHHHIADHSIGHKFLCQFESLFSVGGFNHLIVLTQN